MVKLTREGKAKQKTLKKFLTNEKRFDIILKLSLEKNGRKLRTLITEQYTTTLENFFEEK